MQGSRKRVAGAVDVLSAGCVVCVRAFPVFSEAQVVSGYSPVLTFQVSDLDTLMHRCMSAGAHMDGAIRYESHGKIAVVRSADGVTVSLFEPAGPADTLQ